MFIKFKLFFLHLFEKFKTKGRWLFPLFILLFIPKVNASEILFGPGASFQIGSTIYVDSDRNSLPYNGVVYANGTLNLGALQVSMAPQQNQSILSQPTYNWLYLNICASTASSYLTMNISNSSTLHSFFVSGSYKGVDTGLTCTTQGYNGKQYLFQIPIGKWELGEISEWYEVASYNSFTSTNGVYFTISRVFLADEDITATYRTQQALQDKLNTINTAITNMQNSINSNANSNTQNIINNQNSNTNAINGNIDQEFNDLKNQDHTYNNNANDTPSGQSDINNTLSKQNTLSSGLNLNTNAIDISYNANSSNFIWYLIDGIRSIDPIIPVLITTLLSIGIIKFVLGR